MVGSLERVSASAVTPDQLLPYVHAVSGLQSSICGDCVIHHGFGQGVLVGYPLHDPHDAEAMNRAVDLALAMPSIEKLTVLSALRPARAPTEASIHSDSYWLANLPLRPNAKTRNMLRRAAREINIEKQSGAAAWTSAHTKLVDDFCRRKKQRLDDGSLYIFGHLDKYLAQAPDSALFSALDPNGALVALAIGDYASLSTAFYMFAFRNANTSPGVADALLAALADEAVSRGHARLNFGLGIDAGIGFFKKKWGAEPTLPYIETSWQTRPKPRGLLARLFGSRRQ